MGLGLYSEPENIGQQTKVTSPPQNDPLTVAEVKTYLKAQYGTDALEDALITEMIKAGVAFIENYLEQSIITQTRQLYLGEYAREVPLPYGPVQAVTLVERIDNEDATVLVSGTDYYTTGLDEKVLRFARTWSSGPVIKYQLRVTYDAGYGDNDTDVPDLIKLGLKKQIGTDYYYRLNVSPDGLQSLSGDAKGVLRSLKKTKQFF